MDILLLFFLQAKLPEAGMPNWALGFGLFMMEMGWIAGARAILQNRFPSEQRATLLSMESFTFSVIMMVLSPLAGVIFSRW